MTTMISTTSDNLRRQEVLIEKFLAGERKSSILCVTDANAKILRYKFPEIRLKKREKVNKLLGLYVFVIKRK